METDIDDRVAQAADRLNALVLPAAETRLAELGVEGSGAYNFYKVRIEQGRLFAHYDLQLATRLLAAPTRPDVLHEIGGGFGSFSWLMTALGFRTVCLEQDIRRFNGAQALWAAVVAGWPALGDRLRLVCDRFPSTQAEPDGAWAIITNLVATTTETQRFAIIAALKRYPAAIVDVDRFLERARSAEDRATVVDGFERAGMAAEPFLDLGSSACFFRLGGTPSDWAE